jgi:hypothetical protein
MPSLLSEIKMVREHVRRGKEILLRQREIITLLRDRSRPTRATKVAEDLLRIFEEVQIEHEAHLARLLADNPG